MKTEERSISRSQAGHIVPELPLALVGELARWGDEVDETHLRDLLQKADSLVGLELGEAAALLRVARSHQREAVFGTARAVKKRIYGRREVLFAPLYAANECVNNCLYCGYRADNTGLTRSVLSMEEIAAETTAIEQLGHKRILLVMGESPGTEVDYAARAVAAIYEARSGRGAIRRVNVNMAPQSVGDFRALKASGIGTYQCFQETYCPDQYRQMHPSGPKADYEWRLGAFDRAFAARIDDVGLGVLYGLYDFRFDTLALLAHAQYLDRRYGVGPHTLSFPRIEPAEHAPAAEHIPYPVSDQQLLLAVAVLRLACPYTGIIMSTRESPELRRKLLSVGVSQLSAGSRTYPGGYRGDHLANEPDRQQFAIGDERPPDLVIRELAEDGYLPSFCTACYRLGRTGHDFMEKAKPGEIQEFCTPNAILTFQEYLLDYASAETRKCGEQAVARALAEVAPRLRHTVEDRLARIRAGERDLFL